MDTDYQLCFSEASDSWSERWAALREFTRRWCQADVPDSFAAGGVAGRVEQEAAKLGVQLPPSLKEWMRFSEAFIAGEKRDVFEDILRDYYVVEWLVDHRAVSLMIQVEGDYYWAVREDNLHLDDPPVDGYGLDYECVECVDEHFLHEGRVAEHITTFVLGHMLPHLLARGGRFGFTIDVDEVDKTLGELRAAFDVYTRWGDLHIFEKENVLAVASPDEPRSENLGLEVLLWKPVPKDVIPGCVLEKAEKAGWSNKGLRRIR